MCYITNMKNLTIFTKPLTNVLKILNNPFNEIRGQRLMDLSGFCFFYSVNL